MFHFLITKITLETTIQATENTEMKQVSGCLTTYLKDDRNHCSNKLIFSVNSVFSVANVFSEF